MGIVNVMALENAISWRQSVICVPLAVVPVLSPVTVATLALSKYLLIIWPSLRAHGNLCNQHSAQGDCFPVLSFSEAGLKWLPLSSLSFPPTVK